MKKIELPLLNLLKTRLKEKSPLIQVICGPRQIGKSTSLQQFHEQSGSEKKIYLVSGDGIAQANWINEQWQNAIDTNRILIIDEIQKIPQWSETVKKLWDAGIRNHRPIKCVLTGSSSLSLQNGLTESLTGRFELIQANHWTLDQTLAIKKMSLNEYLTFGGYPGSYRFLNNLQRWSSYMTQSIVETVITKDILTQAHVKSPALFRQAFYMFSSVPAQVISYHKLLGQLQDKGNIDLIKYYLYLFENAFLIKTIHKFSNNEIKKKGSSPKIILMAPALSSFHRLDNLDETAYGRIFESMVGAEFIKANLEIFYWSEGDYEVDFVLKHKDKLIAIEVKSRRNKKATSIEYFLKKYPEAHTIFITKDNFQIFSKDVKAFLAKHTMAK